MGEHTTNLAVVYHGTTLEKARNICKQNKISVAVGENRRYGSTTEGYVYVTKNLCDALEFSTRPKKGERIEDFVVFKIFIDENELLADEDELSIKSTLSDDGGEGCFRVKRDLIIGKDVVAVFRKKMPDNKKQGAYMQGVQYGEVVIKESEWKKFEQNDIH